MNMKIFVGYAAMLASGITWLAVFIVPFLGLNATDITFWMATMYALSYLFFFVGTFALGKKAIGHLKRKITQRFFAKPQIDELETEASSQPKSP